MRRPASLFAGIARPTIEVRACYNRRWFLFLLIADAET
jgi:hypothetical protein